MDAEHVISQIQRELDAEVIYQNRKHMWTLEQLKASIPGVTAVYNDNGFQYVTLNDRTIRFGNAASLNQIASAFNLDKIDKIVISSKTTITMAKSPLAGLGNKLGLLKHNAEADAAKIGAKVDELEARRQAAIPKVLSGLESQAADLADVETFVADLEKATNE